MLKNIRDYAADVLRGAHPESFEDKKGKQITHLSNKKFAELVKKHKDTLSKESMTVFDSPAIATVLKGMLRKKISEDMLSLKVQGMNAQLIPDYQQDLKFDVNGYSEVRAPWTLYFERIDGYNDQQMIDHANEMLKKDPKSFEMASARVPISGPMSGFCW